MNRENALEAYLTNIKKSWTWERLTDKEKKTFEYRLRLYQNGNQIQGTYSQRTMVCSMMYDMFLAGLGFYEDCIHWRE